MNTRPIREGELYDNWQGKRVQAESGGLLVNGVIIREQQLIEALVGLGYRAPRKRREEE